MLPYDLEIPARNPRPVHVLTLPMRTTCKHLEQCSHTFNRDQVPSAIPHGSFLIHEYHACALHGKTAHMNAFHNRKLCNIFCKMKPVMFQYSTAVQQCHSFSSRLIQTRTCLLVWEQDFHFLEDGAGGRVEHDSECVDNSSKTSDHIRSNWRVESHETCATYQRGRFKRNKIWLHAPYESWIIELEFECLGLFSAHISSPIGQRRASEKFLRNNPRIRRHWLSNESNMKITFSRQKRRDRVVKYCTLNTRMWHPWRV